MKIGFIQTGGLGDVVIAAPIAQCYIEQGHDVYWPIDSCYYRCAQMAFPEINFLEIVRSKTGFMTAEYFVGGPYVMLTELGCEQIFSLYSYLTGMSIANEGLARSLKFDEYK